jgi:ApaG protein
MPTDRPSKPGTQAASRGREADGAGDSYEATTDGIMVRVTPHYDPDRSKPEQGQYFWLYAVEIRNGSKASVQLLTRHWRITDALGRLQEVRGDGVVGQQPVIEPGGEFRYTSGCPLTTPSGFMAGSYHLETAAGVRFDATIPTFSLDSPHMPRSLN